MNRRGRPGLIPALALVAAWAAAIPAFAQSYEVETIDVPKDTPIIQTIGVICCFPPPGRPATNSCQSVLRP